MSSSLQKAFDHEKIRLAGGVTLSVKPLSTFDDDSSTPVHQKNPQVTFSLSKPGASRNNEALKLYKHG